MAIERRNKGRSPEEEARQSASGADRMTQNADISENALSGSTTGRDIDYGMGDEGEPAGSDGLRDSRSGGNQGDPGGTAGGSHLQGSRDRRSGGEGESHQDDKAESGSGGGGSRDRRSGGSESDSETMKTHRTRRSSH